MRDGYDQNIYIGSFVRLEGLSAQYCLVVDLKDDGFTFDYLTMEAVFLGRHEMDPLQARNRNITVVSEGHLVAKLKEKRKEILAQYHSENPEAESRYKYDLLCKQAETPVVRMRRRRAGGRKKSPSETSLIVPFPQSPEQKPETPKPIVPVARVPRKELE